MRPTVRQLECVVAVADHLNFRRAAEACYITQPALSVHVAQLETFLGVRLFERDRRRVLITAEGERLVGHARRSLEEIDGFVDAARLLDRPLSGRLRLGVIPTVAPYVLPVALPAVRRRYPDLRLLLREARTGTLVDLLGQGELDLLLLALEADLGEPTVRPLYRDPFLLAVPKEHPLAGRRSVKESDLASEEILLLEDGHCLRDQALSLCAAGGARELGDFRASSLNTLVQMVANGIGATLLPAMSIQAEIHRRDRIRTVPLVKRAPSRTIGLAWRRTSARNDEFELLADLFTEHAPLGVEPIHRGR